VRRLNEEFNTTIFLTTQYLEEADQLADRIAIIDEGRLIAEGTADELKGMIGGERIELTFSDETATERVREAFGGTVEKGKLILPSTGMETLSQVVRHLDEHQLTAETRFVKQQSLDDVLIRRTGQAYEKEGE